MHVGLVAFHFVIPGIKMLSGYLRARGIKTSIIYLPMERSYDPEYRFSEELKESFVQLSRKFDVVGFSVFTHNFYLAKDLTEGLKADNHPMVVWGGIHPTLDPDSCQGIPDAICLGEAEESMAEFVECLEGAGDPWSVKGFHFYRPEGVIKTPLAPPPHDLNALPYPDIGWEGHYIEDGKSGTSIVPLNAARLKEEFSVSRMRDANGIEHPIYLSVFSRGCPCLCTFCCNNLLNDMYGKDRLVVRMRSVDNIIGEVQHARDSIADFGFIAIEDDNFMAQPRSFIDEFCDRWPKEVSIPFKTTGSLQFIKPDKIDPLVEAGLMHLQVGIQTGSDRLNKEIYRRPPMRKRLLKAAEVMRRHEGRLLPAYDVIFDNPYETFDDRLDTARLIQELPKPFVFSAFSLVFFPGTELYERAMKDELIKDAFTEVFHKKSNDFNLKTVSYLKLVTLLMPSLPPWLGKALIFRPLARFFEMKAWTILFTGLARFLFWLRGLNIIKRINSGSLLTPRLYEKSEGQEALAC